MDTILIQPGNEAEWQLIQKFIKEHNLKNRILPEEDKEDFVLAQMMEETDYTDTINTDHFLNQLRS